MIRISFLLTRLALFCAFASLAYLSATVKNPADDLKALESQPNYDFRAAAENLWSADKADEALAHLEYAVINKLPDADACAGLRKKYLAEVAERTSPWGRLCAFGRGFVTGNVDGVDSLAGSVGADIVVYGDVRDIAKETFFNEKTDYVILSLSSVGLATTLYPPADGTVSLLKIAKKTHSLSAGLEKSVVDAFKLATKVHAKKATEILKNSLEPIAALSKKTKTWTGFAKVLKYADSPAQIDDICKLLDKSPLNAAKLEQILTVAGDNAKYAFDFVAANSQKGMDFVYSLMGKGPRAIKFVAKHPSLISHAAKNSYKTYPLAIKSLKSLMSAQIFKYGEFFRWIVALLFATVAFIFVIPYKFIFQSSLSVDKKHYVRRAFFGSVCLCALLGIISTGVLAFYIREDKFAGNTVAAGKNSPNLTLADWADKICQIDVRILEDAYINEVFDISIKAPIVGINGQNYAVCGFDAIGFGLKQIRDGGVYELDFRVGKRSKNPLSFSPEFVLADANGNVLIPLPFEKISALKLAGNDISADDIALFSRLDGFKNSNVKFAAFCEFELAINSKCLDSDSIVTRRGEFFGLIRLTPNGSFICKRLSADSIPFFEKIPLTKQNSDVYFYDFIKATIKIQDKIKRQFTL